MKTLGNLGYNPDLDAIECRVMGDHYSAANDTRRAADYYGAAIKHHTHAIEELARMVNSQNYLYHDAIEQQSLHLQQTVAELQKKLAAQLEAEEPDPAPAPPGFAT